MFPNTLDMSPNTLVTQRTCHPTHIRVTQHITMLPNTYEPQHICSPTHLICHPTYIICYPTHMSVTQHICVVVQHDCVPNSIMLDNNAYVLGNLFPNRYKVCWGTLRLLPNIYTHVVQRIYPTHIKFYMCWVYVLGHTSICVGEQVCWGTLLRPRPADASVIPWVTISRGCYLVGT